MPTRMETEGETFEKVKVDNMDYSVVLVEGQERFACNKCDFKADKSGSMKRHITTKHVSSRLTGQGRKRKSMESGKLESSSKEVGSSITPMRRVPLVNSSPSLFFMFSARESASRLVCSS